jgi:hypothetical protein
MTESKILAKVFRKLGARQDVKVFRNNVARAWVGKVISHTPQRTVLQNARPLHAGLFKGSSDLVGWMERPITQADVGKTIAQFVSLEAKTETGRCTPEQQNWLTAVCRAGGLGYVVRSDAEASLLITPTPLPR